VRDEEAGLEREQLVAGDDDVAHEDARNSCGCESDGPRAPQDPGPRANDSRHETDEGLVRPPVRAGGVERDVVVAHAGVDADPRGVADGDRLDLVRPVAGYQEDRDVAQAPGDVVHEDVVGPEIEGRTNDRVREARPPERLFGPRFPAEVRKR
jgi:hypothetical protein